MVETLLTCVAVYGGRAREVPAWLSLREKLVRLERWRANLLWLVEVVGGG